MHASIITIWIHPVNSQQWKCITNHCEGFISTWIFSEPFPSDSAPLSKKTNFSYETELRILEVKSRYEESKDNGVTWDQNSTTQHCSERQLICSSVSGFFFSLSLCKPLFVRGKTTELTFLASYKLITPARVAWGKHVAHLLQLRDSLFVFQVVKVTVVGQFY